MTLRASCWSLPIFLALAACEKESLPQKPQLIVDRESLGFGMEFGSGAYIGTQRQESLMLQNGGLEDLIISTVALSGDGVFTLEGPSKEQLKGKERAYVRLFFKPTQEKQYAGTLTIHSNAENEPTKLIPLSGRGVRPGTDGGG